MSAQAADLASPLLIASQEGHGACVDFLLDHGADPNLDCSHEWPQLPIHAAAEFGHIGYRLTTCLAAMREFVPVVRGPERCVFLNVS